MSEKKEEYCKDCIIILLKECAMCKLIKPKVLFYKDKNRVDGFYCYCKDCSAKEHKEYAKNNKYKIEIKSREWRDKNKESLNKKQREYMKKTNYASEKTPNQRKIRYIKRETRRKYPLKNQQCKYCGEVATEHHHITKPITINEFEFVCHKCHVQAERQQKGGNK